MMDGTPHFIPARKDLLLRELSDEVILYDKTTHRAHCLNHSAAAVWKLCDGNNRVGDIARLLELESVEVVWTALHELNKAELLQNQIPPSIANNMLSRRELVKHMGVGTALAIPITRSILVPRATAAVSPTRSRQGRLLRHRRNT